MKEREKNDGWGAMALSFDLFSTSKFTTESNGTSFLRENLHDVNCLYLYFFFFITFILAMPLGEPFTN